MGKYVTSGGFKRPTLNEIKTQLEEGFKGVFGPSFDINQDSPNGYLIAMLSRVLGNVYELGQEVYDAHTTSGSTGVALDDILSLCSIQRLKDSATTGKALMYADSSSGDVVVPKGSLVSTEKGLNFSLDSQVIIDNSVNEVRFKIGQIPSGSSEVTYDFVFGAYTISVQGVAGIDYLLLNAIANGSYPLTAYMGGDGVIVVRNEYERFSYTLPSFCDVKSRAIYGYFTCTETGPNSVGAGMLNTIVSSVDGWDRVNNVDPLQTGSNYETDSEARLRLMRETYTDRAFGTDKSIASRLVNSVNGVTTAVVKSNRSLVVDSEGRPPKSFEAIVTGGSDKEVAECIFDNACCGIETWGKTQVKIYDGNGDEQLVRFSRPEPVYLWIDVRGVYYDEESFTDDGIYRMKQAIISWAQKEYSIGKDIIPDRIKSPVYTIDGVGQVTIKVGTTEKEDASMPSLVDETISVSSYKYAVVSSSRISITLV